MTRHEAIIILDSYNSINSKIDIIMKHCNLLEECDLIENEHITPVYRQENEIKEILADIIGLTYRALNQQNANEQDSTVYWHPIIKEKYND